MKRNVVKAIIAGTAIAVQCVAIGWLVWRYESIVRFGKEVRFRCEAYDPYDPLRGRYLRVTVRETCTNLLDRADGKAWETTYGAGLFAKLEPGTNGLWRVAAVADSMPADGGLFAAAGAERGKVVFPDEKSGGATHGGFIQRLWELPDVFAFKDAGGVAVPDAVDVGFPCAAQPCVKARRGFGEGKDADVLREVGAQGRKQLFAGKPGLGAEGGRLLSGMDAGVRASGAVDLNALTEQAGERLLQLALNGRAGVALALPAAVTAAVVAQLHFKVSHHRSLLRKTASMVPCAAERQKSAVFRR